MMHLKSTAFLFFVLTSLSMLTTHARPLPTTEEQSLTTNTVNTEIPTSTTTSVPDSQSTTIPDAPEDPEHPVESEKGQASADGSEFPEGSPERESATPDVVKQEVDTEPHKGGQITPYNPMGVMSGTGIPACGGDPITENHWVVALSHNFFDTYPGYDGVNTNNNPLCGKEIIATYKGKTVKAVALDRCHDCTGVHNLDLTTIAFKALTGENVGRIKDGELVWRFADDKPGQKPFVVLEGEGAGVVTEDAGAGGAEGADVPPPTEPAATETDTGSVTLAVEPTTTATKLRRSRETALPLPDGTGVEPIDHTVPTPTPEV